MEEEEEEQEEDRGGAHHVFSHLGLAVDDPLLGAYQTVHAGHGGAWRSRGELGQ